MDIIGDERPFAARASKRADREENAGPSRGEVWHDSRADGRGVYPATAPDGHHLGFLEWYEQWLDKSLAEF